MYARVPPRLWVIAALLAALVALALVVTDDNWVTQGDLDIVRAVAADRSSWIGDLAELVSWLGNVLVLGVIGLVAAAVMLRQRAPAWRAFLPLAALGVAAVLDPLAKLAVGRPRPPLELAEVVETATGYPSGHSAQAAAFWLTLAFAASAHAGPGGRRRLLSMAVLLVIAVGVSRVVLGVHSPTDVIGGWCLGLACALGAMEVADRRTRKAPHERGRTDVIDTEAKHL